VPTIYRFTVYDIQSDESRLSRRWGTLIGIKTANGQPLLETATEADASIIGRDGLTERDYNPNPHPPGFQRQV
jgi:hypothetical protein